MNKKFIIGVFSTGILAIRHLSEFLSAREFIFRPKDQDASRLDFIIGWGEKPNTHKAQNYALRHHLPYVRLEDGFIHSTGQGVLGNSSCSMVIDQNGIYYNTQYPSTLEILIEEAHKNSETINLRARDCMQRIINQHISKYNNSPISLAALGLPLGKKILVIDQTAGDMSLYYGGANHETFDKMLIAAFNEHPDATILVKIHPDVITGHKKSCFSKKLLNHPRILLIDKFINPIALIQQCDHVYVATSQMGFEALMIGKPVTCFGKPFYSGWGLTDDRLPLSRHIGQSRTLEQIFAAMYFNYSRYVHPDRGESCALEEILDYFEQQYHFFRENAGRLYCFGFTLWKRNYIRAFLRSPDNKIMFVRHARNAIKQGCDINSHIIVWGNRAAKHAEYLAARFNLPIWRMEDGFIRSTELGSDFTAPASLVLDKTGIYYDPNHPSNLESILATTEFDQKLLTRAQNLRKLLIERQISKYNVGRRFDRSMFKTQAGQLIILVPGQVENDISIRKGCLEINTNTKLLNLVRDNNPDAFIIFKPHPDVESGNRSGKVANKVLTNCCDLVVNDVSITDCLSVVDQVHTMTSLVGFEGLLRNLNITVYGLPFYSGWGLTNDYYPHPRRTRTLILDELVAATLILYPRYINWETQAFTTPEFIIDDLNKKILQQGGKSANNISWLLRKTKQLNYLWRGIF